MAKCDVSGPSLADLAPGQWGTVTHVDGSNRLGRRLLDLGLTPGVKVEVEGHAPLGDPLIIRARGCRMGIRRCEAKCVPCIPSESCCALSGQRRGRRARWGRLGRRK